MSHSVRIVVSVCLILSGLFCMSYSVRIVVGIGLHPHGLVAIFFIMQTTYSSSWFQRRALVGLSARANNSELPPAGQVQMFVGDLRSIRKSVNSPDNSASYPTVTSDSFPVVCPSCGVRYKVV